MAFKTKLPEAITSITKAKKYLKELCKNGESYHPDDPASDIIWACDEPTAKQKKQLDKLMTDIFSLKEVKNNFEFDPYGFILGETYTYEIYQHKCSLRDANVRTKCNENELKDHLATMEDKSASKVIAWLNEGVDIGGKFYDSVNYITYKKIY